MTSARFIVNVDYMDQVAKTLTDSTLSSEDAARLLGVSLKTLYAYVSRGLIAPSRSADRRESRYSKDAVEQLAAVRRRGRRPKEIAKATLNWGIPVLETEITLIDGGRLFYRGQDAVRLSRSFSLEDAACLLWSFEKPAAFPRKPPQASPDFVNLIRDDPGPAFREGVLARLAVATSDEATAPWQAGPNLASGCGDLVRLLLASMLGAPPSSDDVHEQCARAWGLDPEAADILRQALVLCADHELNASSFAARCIASTGASLRAAVIGGLAALSGGLHGGMTSRVEAFWRGLGDGPQIVRSLRSTLSSGSDIPGFGHPLYPQGDVRAATILQRIRARDDSSLEIASGVLDLTGNHPSLDFALVALRRALGLPDEAAFGLFALGRSVGWIAQALEQRAAGQLIRPRAVYKGPAPG